MQAINTERRVILGHSVSGSNPLIVLVWCLYQSTATESGGCANCLVHVPEEKQRDTGRDELPTDPLKSMAPIT